MRTLLLSILLAASATTWAYTCTSSMVTQADGKLVSCTTCCTAGVCSTQCF